jgi:branched-chain amino acid transport system substrate-binding protein
MKKVLLLILVLVGALGLAACTKEEKVQGVTDTTIKVGNTAATSGALAAVGVPFNDALKAVFEVVNEAGGIDGRTIEFVTYDDEFNAEKGLAFTEKLIEEDQIFALVGHFGTPTVGATLDLIQSVGIPMVYAATGINGLYFQESVGNPVMAVQPIYLTDGRLMTARALKESVYGPNSNQPLAANAKVGVLYTNDDVGNSVKAGVEAEAQILGKSANFVYEAVTNDTVATAVQKLKTENVQVVILAMNQVPFGYSLSALYDADLNVPVFSSYVNADVTVVNHLQAPTHIYVNAWVDIFTTEGQAAVQDFVAAIAGASFLTEAQKTAYYTNSFAIAGYIAAKIFVEGLERVAANGEKLTWASYIRAMEEGPIDVPMGGTVDFSGGKRWGIASMSLLKYVYTPAAGETPMSEAFIKVREIETVEAIEAK